MVIAVSIAKGILNNWNNYSEEILKLISKLKMYFEMTESVRKLIVFFMPLSYHSTALYGSLVYYCAQYYRSVINQAFYNVVVNHLYCLVVFNLALKSPVVNYFVLYSPALYTLVFCCPFVQFFNRCALQCNIFFILIP